MIRHSRKQTAFNRVSSTDEYALANCCKLEYSRVPLFSSLASVSLIGSSGYLAERAFHFLAVNLIGQSAGITGLDMVWTHMALVLIA